MAVNNVLRDIQRNSLTEQGMAVNNVRGSAVTLFPEVPYTKVVPISVYVSGSEANFRVSIPQKNVLNLSMDIGKAQQDCSRILLEDPRDIQRHKKFPYGTRNGCKQCQRKCGDVFPEVPYTKVVPISVYVSGSEANFRVSIPQKNVLNLSMDIEKVWRGFQSTRPSFRPLNKPPASI
ncbi:hypothetical protein TNCV_1515252 [Trichonephila clavipes]|nr:hypothetical protein TNCV_1515252 [Trichonephila clavipes]